MQRNRFFVSIVALLSLGNAGLLAAGECLQSAQLSGADNADLRHTIDSPATGSTDESYLLGPKGLSFLRLGSALDPEVGRGQSAPGCPLYGATLRGFGLPARSEICVEFPSLDLAVILSRSKRSVEALLVANPLYRFAENRSVAVNEMVDPEALTALGFTALSHSEQLSFQRPGLVLIADPATKNISAIVILRDHERLAAPTAGTAVRHHHP